MNRPLVTVVTPSYNQGHFIRATIESVLSQDYPNLEYIIMDGGSTDSTASIVKDYASRLTFISERDRGQSHAINKGFLMAHGGIVSWLNSDDLYLPGAISKAVEAFQQNPTAGAVYGEGNLIDAEGRITSRFPHTEAFNLWKLVHLSDYILQQTVYFRKDVLEQIGYLNEELHYIMDWDVLIRIGKCYALEYIPEYLGCLREYPQAKTFSGGARRTAEILQMLRHHTGLRFPPGYVVYGLDTYHQLWCARIGQLFGEPLKPVAQRLQRGVRLAAGLVIGRTVRDSQGLYRDGWVCRVLRYMLPPGRGPLLIEGTVPDWKPLRNQKLTVYANGSWLGEFPVNAGDFQVTVDVPGEFEDRLLSLKVKASRSVMPGRFRWYGDRRHLAWRFKSIGWAEPPRRSSSQAIPVYAGQ
jgi:hypothetical protein